MGSALLMALGVLVVTAPAHGFGPQGHRIAGRLAMSRLCEPARLEIERLTDGGGLEAIGEWADRIRSARQWSHTNPWHYMNVDDGAPMGTRRTPPEGDVLWAITHFAAELRNAAADEERATALRFLAHFIVDVHQPLHVGRESDRGGNTIALVVRGEEVSLHRFWDSEVIALEGLSVHRYVQRIAPLADQYGTEWSKQPPLEWAEESRVLRPQIYAFDPRAKVLGERYLRRARAITRTRLAQAGARLASELNRLLCPLGPRL